MSTTATQLWGKKSGVLNRFTVLLLFFSIALQEGCVLEKGFIFFPEKRITATPENFGLSYKDVFIRTEDDVEINGWFVPFKGSRQTLLWLHGNAGNISNRLELLRHFHQKLKQNIFIIDYRGYGRSSGSISEKGTARDALAAFDYLAARRGIDPKEKEIILFGRSLGAAVAVNLATQRQAGGMILEAPFASIKEMAQAIFPWLPVGRFLSTKYDSISKIRQIHIPILILHGDQDEVVPFRQGRSLFEAANDPKKFYTISGAGHNNSWTVGGLGYFEVMSEFLEGL